MSGWHIAHLVFLSAWGGLILGEAAVEFPARSSESLKAAAARFHYWMDLFVEIPLLLGVVLTGGVLFGRAGWSPLLGIKAACGLAAVAANVMCVVMVIRRSKARPDSVDALTQWIFRAPAIGIPFALVALGIGAHRAGWI